MSLAQDVLSRAIIQGLQIEAKGTRLRLRAARQPSTELLTELARNKPAIISLLRPVDDCSSGADYRALFDKRVAIADVDGQSRDEAENTAFDTCVAEWLNRHPVSSDPDQCVWCKGVKQPGCPVVPFGASHSGHAWMHPECWRDWFGHRRHMAVKALSKFGIRPNNTGERSGGLNDGPTLQLGGAGDA